VIAVTDSHCPTVVRHVRQELNTKTNNNHIIVTIKAY